MPLHQFPPTLRHDPSLRRHYPTSAVLRTHPPSAFADAGPRGFIVGTELPLPTTIADFPCCALLMSRACCHHYPGGIVGCVSRSGDGGLPRYCGGSAPTWTIS